MLKSFTLKNFKSFKEATLKLTPTVTFLIGANGSGKSNALEALRFLSWLGQGKRMEEIEKEINIPNSLIRGSVSDIFRYKSKSLEFNVCLDDRNIPLEWSTIIGDDYDDSRKDVKHLSYEKHLFVSRESLYDHSTESLIYEYPSDSGNGISALIGSVHEGNDKGKAVFYGLEALSLLVAGSSLPEPDKSRAVMIHHATNAYVKHFSSILFFGFEPSKMRNYVSQNGNTKLTEDGQNLSEVLKNLCKEETQKLKILEAIKDLPEQSYKDLSFIEMKESRDVMAVLVEQTGKKKQRIYAKLLSDGTLRALAIAAALYGAPEGSLVVIEEVDNGIHPSRIKHLVDKMYEIAAERKIQILVTTHDPAMMDAIPPQEKENILCCYRNKEDGCSSILRLQDSPQYMDFLTNGRLGSFVATELFDKLVRQTEEERAKEHKAWFEQYQKEQDDYYEKLRQALKED